MNSRHNIMLACVAAGLVIMLCFTISMHMHRLNNLGLDDLLLILGGLVLGITSLLFSRKQRRHSLKHSVGPEILPVSDDDDTVEDTEMSCLSRRAVSEMLVALEASNCELRESEERYRVFIEQSSEGVCRLELERPMPIDAPVEEQFKHLQECTYLAECNDIFARMYGYESAAEATGVKLKNAVSYLSNENSTINFRNFLRSGYRLTDAEVERRDKDGDLLYLMGSVVGIIQNGYLVRIWGNFRDITAQKHAQVRLHLQSSAINSASDQIIITNVDGAIEFVNPAFERQTGYEFEEVAGRNPHFLYCGGHNEDYYDELQKTVLAGNTWRGEIINHRKDGSFCTIDVTITPVFGDSGAIEHFVAIRRDVTEKKIYEERLDHLAHHDPLTSLPNRLLFGDRLTQSLTSARRNDESLAVVFLDLDRFKMINDTLGHNIGDLILKVVAKRLTERLRDVDTIARMGGDEFTIILENIKGTQGAARVAEKILNIFHDPFMVEGHDLHISASIGISIYPADGENAETLVKNADTAMYRAKELGRNTYQLYTEAMNTAMIEKMTLEKSLRKALDRGQLTVDYQPRVNLVGDRIMGMEALVRWHHPDLGTIPPVRFIPLAEETGLIVPLTEYVLYEACRQNKRWQDAGFPAMDVAVNISARHFQQGDLVNTVKQVLEDTGLEPQYLDLEITESSLMQNPELAIKSLQELKKLGVRISVDDFGTGYSSLSYLKKFPINTVKIDQSFVHDITSNSDDAAIAAAVVAMAHSLKLKVVAEGVETLGQLEFLRSLECDEMQGYFISRPAPSEDITQLLPQAEQKDKAA